MQGAVTYTNWVAFVSVVFDETDEQGKLPLATVTHEGLAPVQFVCKTCPDVPAAKRVNAVPLL